MLGRVRPSRRMTPGLFEEASMDPAGYPWYQVVQGEELAQDDLFDRCPVARYFMRVGLPQDIPAFR